MNDDRTVTNNPEITHGRPGGGPAPAESQRWGQLQILSSVGEGAFGSVYRAWDTVLHRHVALKLLARGSTTAALDEARALAGIDHPHVIRVHGASVHDGVPGLWMDFVEGVTLSTLVHEKGPMDLAEVLDFGRQLVKATAAVHQAGLLHRDIKPDNVMRRPDGTVVLMDLGVSRSRGNRESPSAGTPAFMAPEVLAGAEETPRSDVYGLGALLFFMISGRRPVEGADITQIRQAHAAGNTLCLGELRPDLPLDFTNLVDRSLAPDPADRPTDAEAMASELEVLAAGLAQSQKRWPLLRLAPVLVPLAVLLGMVVWQMTAGKRPEGLLAAEVGYVGFHHGVAQNLGRNQVLAPGDRLGINVELSSPAYVYVLNRDETGAVAVMYPLAGTTTQPLAPGERHYLPGLREGRRVGWTFNTIPGTERFIVIASREKLAEFEEDISRLPTVDLAGGLSVREASAPVMASLLRGVSGLAGVDLPVAGDPAADLASLVSTVAGQEDLGTRKGIWVHEMTLVNEGI